MIAPLLVLGWGNASRGDDALGPLFVERLRTGLPHAWRDKIDFLEDYQLQIEHTLDLAGRRLVLLVDASTNVAAPFEVTTLQAAQDASYTTHSLSPQALLQVYQNLHAQEPPPCILVAIRGESFALGTAPSPSALDHLECAVTWASEALLRDTAAWLD